MLLAGSFAERSASAMDSQCAQIAVAAFAETEQGLRHFFGRNRRVPGPTPDERGRATASAAAVACPAQADRGLDADDIGEANLR